MREKERKRNRKREIVKKKNKIEYLNKMGKKVKFWDVGCVVKWYGIIDKVVFRDSKIG